jgi:acetyl esterase/lipase
MVKGVSKHGFTLVSADYRLAPQVTVAEILNDVQDCLQFVHDKLPEHTPRDVTLDTSRIAVSGSSAGGYLAFLAGLYSDVKIKVILPIYPITNPCGNFFTNPQPIPDGHIDESLVTPYLDRNAEAVADNDQESARNKLYFYMMQEANLASLLSVKPGDGTFIIAEQIKKRGSFLPCFIVHGDADRLVGVEQADEVVDVLKKIGADYEYETPVGVDHLFDLHERVQMETMYAFMAKHL